MRILRAQYFLTYGVMGCLVPFISVYLTGIGLSKAQVLNIMAAASFAAMLSPVLVTLLADARFDSRRLMALAFTAAALALLAMLRVHAFLPVITLWFIHNLFFNPIAPLQDGTNFHIQQRRREAGLPAIGYHRVRVWGSIGYIIPSIALFGFFYYKYTLSIILIAGAAVCTLAAIVALCLPDPSAHHARVVPGSARLPTFAAARTLVAPPLLVFCLAMFILQMAMGAYYPLYPMYLHERIGISNQWLGPISNIGVVVEVCFMLGYGWFIRIFGLKRLMIVGVLCMVIRLVLLAAVPTAFVAIGTQFFHGFQVLVLLVAPPVFLNHHADDRYRHSVQGLYAMFVGSLGRIAGSLLFGPIAQWSLPGAFACAAILCLAAGGLILLAFYEESHVKSPAAVIASSVPAAPAKA